MSTQLQCTQPNSTPSAKWVFDVGGHLVLEYLSVWSAFLGLAGTRTSGPCRNTLERVRTHDHKIYNRIRKACYYIDDPIKSPRLSSPNIVSKVSQVALVEQIKISFSDV